MKDILMRFLDMTFWDILTKLNPIQRKFKFENFISFLQLEHQCPIDSIMSI